MLPKILLILTLFLLTASIAYSEEIPQFHIFNGSISVNGAPAPIGTVITAKIDGVERANFTLTETIGQYALIVNGIDAERGETVFFFINGVKSSQTATFKSSEVTSLDISVEKVSGASQPKGTTDSGVTSTVTKVATPTPDVVMPSGAEPEQTQVQITESKARREEQSKEAGGIKMPGFELAIGIIALICLTKKIRRNKQNA